ncbi:hypothetical protein HaLaN_22044 [Haematococcus lacustris]|uniref:Uncharacterized protein n=1 Tax=Haematococcus lacustris TaxID=44745 RepID=A0A699ZSY6_HAELA|nr:hypothetical protein HaLaN_22044 [Haematococcus lacustris]
MYSVNTLCTLHSPILNSRGITADCDGYAVVVDFKPSGFVANGTSFWIAHSKTIMEYNDTGECLQSIPGPAKASFMEILGDTNNLCKLDLQSGECRVLKVSSWLGGRLMSGDDQLALLLVPEDDGSSCYSCSAEGMQVAA